MEPARRRPGGHAAGRRDLAGAARHRPPAELAVPIAQGAHGLAAPQGYATDRTRVDGDLDYTGGAFGLRGEHLRAAAILAR